jgi:hypothetical protein
MFGKDAKRSDGGMPTVHSGEKHLADDLPINTDSESATVLDDTSEYMALAKAEGINPAFMAKVAVLNKAMNELGMGRYQWELFFTSGFGWMADNICKQDSRSGIRILLKRRRAPGHLDRHACCW